MSEISDYVKRKDAEEKADKATPRRVSKSNLQWKPKEYPVGKFDFDKVKARLEKFIEEGNKVSVKAMKDNIKRVVRDNPHYKDFAQLLDL